MAKDPTKDLKKDAAEREARTRRAIQTIRSIFYGGMGWSPYSGAYKPGVKYYDPTGDIINVGAGFDAEGHNLSPAGFAQAVKAGKVFTAKKYAGQFTPKFYKGAKDAYTSFIRPQLERKHTQAKEDLTYALSRQGMLDSTLRTERFGNLLEDYGTQKQVVNEQAQDVADSLRANVLQAESQQIANAQASADPALAANMAAASAQSASAIPAFDPLGNVFAEVTSGLATQAELERRKLAAYDVGVSNILGGNSSTIVT